MSLYDMANVTIFNRNRIKIVAKIHKTSDFTWILADVTDAMR